MQVRVAGDFVLYVSFMISPDSMAAASLMEVILGTVSEDIFLIVVV